MAQDCLAHKPLQIAIVGGGPRGFYAIESLAARVGRLALTECLQVVLFEPAEHPGAGTVYALDQPECLRMNFPSKLIDAWRRDREAVGSLEGHAKCLSFEKWLRNVVGPTVDPDDVSSRAMVGRYLHDCFNTVLNYLPPTMSVRVVREKVIGLKRKRDQWMLETDSGSGECILADEVLLTCGHGGWRREEQDCHPREIVCPFPVSRRLSEQAIERGTTVAVKGFSLTFIDTALALTEGRGGAFVEEADALRYRPSGTEPRCVVPFSRTGKPMLAKPTFAMPGPVDQINAVWAAAGAAIRDIAVRAEECGEQTRFVGQILPVLISAAATALLVSSANRELTHSQLEDRLGLRLNRWLEDRKQFASSNDLHERLISSCEIAIGKRAWDDDTVLGEAWRKLYPSIVVAVDGNRAGVIDRQDFFRHASIFEKLAFGPPVKNLRRILSLIDVGIIQTQWRTGNLKWESGEGILQTHNHQMRFDYLVNATMPPPNDSSHIVPLGTLIDEGIFCLTEEGAVKVDVAGRPTGLQDSNDPFASDRNRYAGIALIGRSAEGWVIGHDTLSRTLHDQVEHWAEGVLKRIQTLDDETPAQFVS